MKSRIVTITATAAIALMGSAGAGAQDATPMASPVGESLFADLGLPELTITVTDEGAEIDQSEVEAGRYLVTLNNETAEPEVFAGFVQLPDDRTIDDLSYADEVAAGTPIPQEMPPVEDFAWLYDTYLAGGPSSLTDASRQVVVDLPAGNYGVWDEDPTSPRIAAALTVTGDPAARVEGPEPEAAVTIIEEGEGGVGFSFRADGEFTTGPQIVKVLNASDQPHFMEAAQYPEAMTVDQVMASFMFDPSSGATPSPDMLDFEQITRAGWAGTQSPGATQWVVMDLEAGQVLVDCFIPDPLADFTPHAFEGMIQLFDVAES